MFECRLRQKLRAIWALLSVTFLQPWRSLLKRLVLIPLALCACTMRAQNCQSAYSHCLPGDVLTISSQTFCFEHAR
jgi:hypothetical protein